MFTDELPFELRAFVRTLDEASSRTLWERHVSTVRRERHPMLLTNTHWLGSAKWTATEWSASQNEPARTFLSRALPWAATTEVFFVAMRERSYALPWAVLLDTLCVFVRDDNECSFVFSLETRDFVLFGPHQQIGLGRRGEP